MTQFIRKFSSETLDRRSNLTYFHNDRGKKKQGGSMTSFLMKPPDGGWGWVIVFASFFASLLGDGVSYSYGVLATEFIKHFHLKRSLVGWMASTLIAVTLASGPIASFFSKKYGFRAVSLVGSFICSFGVTVPYFYDRLWFVFLNSSVVAGFGFGLVYLPSIVIVSIWFDKKRPLALGIAVCGSGLGTFIFSPFMEHLVTRYGWQVCMLVVGLILLLLVPCSLTYIDVQYNEIEIKEEIKLHDAERREECEENPKNKDKKVTANDDLLESKKVILKSNVELLQHPLFILFCVSTFFTCIGFDSPYMFAKDRAVQEGLAPSKGSFVISSMGLGNCIGRVMFGLIASQPCINRFHLYTVAIMGSGVLLIGSWGMKSYVFILLNALVFGIWTGTFITLSSIILVDMFGLENLNISFGLSSIFQSVAVLVGPPLIGLIFDCTSSYNVAYSACGLSLCFGGAIMYLAYFSSKFRDIKFRS